MTPQNKTIVSARKDVNVTEIASTNATHTFDGASSVNIHGLNVTIGVSPRGPDETLVGRWYVVLLPKSVASEQAIRNAWIEELNTIAGANEHLTNSEFVWGAGSIVSGEQGPFDVTFSPKSSRNAKQGSQLFVLLVADAISGVVDDWDSASTMSFFTSN